MNGPSSDPNSAIDYDISFDISGGTLVAVGSAGRLAQSPSSSSEQYSLEVNFNSNRSVGQLVHIESESGMKLVTFESTKKYQMFTFSSPDLIEGEKYSIYTRGSHSGASIHGLFENGSYSPGTKYKAFTITGKVTVIQ